MTGLVTAVHYLPLSLSLSLSPLSLSPSLSLSLSLSPSPSLSLQLTESAMEALQHYQAFLTQTVVAYTESISTMDELAGTAAAAADQWSTHC